MKQPDYHHSSAYYAESLAQFYQDVKKPKDYLAHRLADAHRTFHSDPRHDISPSEFNSWRTSPKELASYLQQTNLPLDLIVVLEARIDSWRRIDALLCGKAKKNHDSIMAIEMKQWTASDWFELRKGSQEKSISTVTNGREKLEKNPCSELSARISGIRKDCRDILGDEALELHPYVLLHSHNGRLSDEWRKVIDDPQFNNARKFVPIITDCEDGRDYFRRRVRYEVGQGSGISAYQKFLELGLWQIDYSPEKK